MSDMNEPGYEALAAVLQRAYDQASKGKGKDRHASGEPFTEQVIMLGARKHGIKYAITDTANSSTSSMQSLIDMGYRPFWPAQVKPWALRESVYWKKTL